MSLGGELAKMTGLIFLHGELGAGKTTLVRGMLRALGYEGAVKSPTYTLLELYELSDRSLLHLDIYRLESAQELDMLGVKDELTDDMTVLVEWPLRAQGELGMPGLEIYLSYTDDGARKACLLARNKQARQLLARF